MSEGQRRYFRSSDAAWQPDADGSDAGLGQGGAIGEWATAAAIGDSRVFFAWLLGLLDSNIDHPIRSSPPVQHGRVFLSGLPVRQSDELLGLGD